MGDQMDEEGKGKQPVKDPLTAAQRAQIRKDQRAKEARVPPAGKTFGIV